MSYLERVLFGAAAAVVAAPLVLWLFRRTSTKSAKRRQIVVLLAALVVCGGAVAVLPVPLLVPGSLVALLAVPAAAIDAAERRLPERLCWPLTVGSGCALGVAALCGAPADLCGRSFAAGLAWGVLLFGSFLASRHPGPGDAVLVPGLGFLLGWFGWAWLLAAIVVSYVVFACVGVFAARLQGASLRTFRMPFGPSLVVTAVALSATAAVLTA